MQINSQFLTGIVVVKRDQLEGFLSVYCGKDKRLLDNRVKKYDAVDNKYM